MITLEALTEGSGQNCSEKIENCFTELRRTNFPQIHTMPSKAL